MLKIWYGRENSDREKFIYESIEKDGGLAMVIVPDQYTLEAERQAFRYMNSGVLMDVEVLSLSRLGQRLLKKTGLGRFTFIDRYGRYMLLSRIVSEKDGELTVFRGMKDRESFISMLSDFISEMKQYGVTPEELKAMGDDGSSKSDILKDKLRDLSLIFGEYEKAIDGKYTDSEDRLSLYAKAAAESDEVKNTTFWIYGFDSFTPRNLSVIGALMENGRDVNVVLTCDYSPEYDELFALSKIVIKRLQETASERGIRYRLSEIGDKTEISKAPAMKAIEQSLYSIAPETGADPEGLTVVRCANLYNEAESAAAFILKLIREEGLRYRDIAVICGDSGKRRSILGRVFREYGIDVFDDEKRSILSSPLATYVTALMNTVNGRLRAADLIAVHKSGLSDLTDDEIEEIENYAIKYRIRGNMWKKPFVKGQTEYGDDGLEMINSLRERAVAPTLAMEELFKSSKTVRDFLAGCYGFLSEGGAGERLKEIAELQSGEGLFDLAAETAQSWSMLMSAFDQMAELMGDEPFDGEKTLEILTAGLSQMEIGVLPTSADDVLIGTMQRTRMGEIKALLITGANEGLIPMAPPGDGLFSPEELEYFSGEGKDLCKTDGVRTMEETLAIYRNLSKPEKHLYISYSEADEEGKEIKPSELIGNITRLFPDAEILPDVVNRDDNLDIIGGRVNTLRHFTEELQKAKKGEKIDPVWSDVKNWLAENSPGDMRLLKEGLAFTNSQQPLGKERAKSLFSKAEGQGGKPLSLSPSRIERFGRCPFSHFVAYGLRPKERRIFETAGREIGDLYHGCIMEVSRTLTEQNMWQTVTRDRCRAMVEDVVRKSAATYREGVFDFSGEEKYKTGRVIDACALVCWILVEQVRAGKIKESMYEEAFGTGRKLPEIRVDCAAGTVVIEGKIDRVDILPDDRVKIIDYKTGKEVFDIDEAAAGYRLQLMLYLEAAGDRKGKDRRPAGVFYFRIDDPRESREVMEGEDGAEKLADKIRKHFRMNGLMVNDPAVIDGIAGDFTDASDVVPLKRKKDGEIAAAASTGAGAEFLISEEEFDELRNQVMRTVNNLCADLLDGKIDIRPKMSKKVTPCQYCDYKGICRFDLNFPGCGYDIVK